MTAKPRIAFLFSGEARSNGWNPAYTLDNKVVDSLSSFLFTPSLAEKYEYDVFISTNTLDVDRATAFFVTRGGALRNVHCYDSRTYLHEPLIRNQSFEALCSRFPHIDHGAHYVSAGNLWQMYRIYDAGTLLWDHQAKTSIQYTYIVRLRLDTILTQSFTPLFEMLESMPSLQVLALSDLFLAGRPQAMNEFLRLFVTDYFLFPPVVRKGWDYFLLPSTDYYNNAKCPPRFWTFAPEKQVSECFFRFCDKEGLKYSEALKGLPVHEYLLIYNRALFTA